MKCRVFKVSVGWAIGLFIFEAGVKFKHIRANPQTHFLNQENYVGEFEFELGFLQTFQFKELAEGGYYYEYLWEADQEHWSYRQEMKKEPTKPNFKEIKTGDDFNSLFEAL
jgi:hypothetical protein